MHVVRISGGGHPCWEFNSDANSPTITPSYRQFEPADKKLGTSEKTLCHLFVKNGTIQYLGDCDHALKNTTIPMQPIPNNYGGLED